MLGLEGHEPGPILVFKILKRVADLIVIHEVIHFVRGSPDSEVI